MAMDKRALLKVWEWFHVKKNNTKQRIIGVQDFLRFLGTRGWKRAIHVDDPADVVVKIPRRSVRAMFYCRHGASRNRAGVILCRDATGFMPTNEPILLEAEERLGDLNIWPSGLQTTLKIRRTLLTRPITMVVRRDWDRDFYRLVLEP